MTKENQRKIAQQSLRSFFVMPAKAGIQ